MSKKDTLIQMLQENQLITVHILYDTGEDELGGATPYYNARVEFQDDILLVNNEIKIPVADEFIEEIEPAEGIATISFDEEDYTVLVEISAS